MLGRLFGRREPQAATVHVEPFGWEFHVEPGQTILQAALARGLPWPSRCRVGSCTTCRCRLLDGDVRALTDTSYVLSKEQLAARVILACQSQPRGPIRVHLARTKATLRRDADDPGAAAADPALPAA
ncbi:MAG TPA: 2Fe-2S iron-sulfur cluster binding domain-containing protein [Steroidobacteraceae bacterium]|nr:2Fe-2S iron-sulfur cluster binding domain-containing protein [Steroidobacteraceae bacterium]